MICLVNKSTLLRDADVRLMARACAAQVRLHLAPAWGMAPIPVVYLSSKDDAPPGAWVLTVLDDSDQADALGWHSEDDSGLYYGRIFARPVLDNGGNALTKNLSVASVGSHEVCEIFCDPSCNLYAERDQHTEIAVEVCDPVESDSYVIKIDGISITVSNFVTRRWFDPQAQGGRFDYLGKLTTPFTMTKGGYVIVKKDGIVSQQFGDRYPEWRKDTKQHPLARTSRRVLHVG
jgi:hypothetical protein